MSRPRTRSHVRHGDYLIIDDRTGFTEWRGDCVKEWTGAIVHRSQYEARHPQDFIRARREDFRLRDARPEPAIANANFTGPLTTTIAADVAGDNDQHAPMGTLGQFALGQAEEDLEESNTAGSEYITVDSTSGMSAYDQLAITLDSGDVFLTLIRSVVSSSILLLTDPLPGSVSVGNLVVDYTANIS